MSFTGLQETRTRTREQKRRMAWIDRRAYTVGYLDAQLARGACPYTDPDEVALWHEGYDAATAERDAQAVKTEASLQSVSEQFRAEVISTSRRQTGQ